MKPKHSISALAIAACPDFLVRLPHVHLQMCRRASLLDPRR